MEAQKEKQLEERAKFIEKTKNLLIFKDDPAEDRPSKKGKVLEQFCLLTKSIFNMIRHCS